MVLLTKADLAGEAGLAAARRVIEKEAARPLPMLAVTDGAIDPQVILGLNAAAENDLAARPSHHDGEEEHEHDDFASVVVELPEVSDIDAMVAAIGKLAREQNVLRAKGFLAVKGKPMRLLVQSVGERVRHQFDKPWGVAPRQSKLVVIGEQGDIDEDAIRAALGILGLGL
jgi:cobalamin biosynthesis protein CobW